VAAACNGGEETRRNGKPKWEEEAVNHNKKRERENNGEGKDLANKAEKLEITCRRNEAENSSKRPSDFRN
jgi:hypothetical protein